MFVQHPQLKVLNVPASKVVRLNTSGGSAQMVFTGYPSQMCSAYLASINSGSKVLVVVGFYLQESRQSIFFVPKTGEIQVEKAEQTFEEGIIFAETMGFVLSETDYHLLSADDQQKLWSSLPICRIEAAPVPKETAKSTSSASSAAQPEKPQRKETVEVTEDKLNEYRERSLKSLGRFLSSM